LKIRIEVFVRLSRIKLHADRAPEAQNPMEKRFSWRLGALASAVALLGSLTSLETHALGLGRISVQSALGEPLRAEIDIAEINAEEASSLRAGVASAEVFRAAGLEYSSAISDLQISIQKRADGRSYFRLSSARAVTEPFVDLILEANWSSGRIVRDYTMLFDPPNLRQSGSAGSAASVTAPALSRPAIPVAPPAAGIASTPYYPTRPPPAQAPVRPAPAAKAQPAKVTLAAPKAAVAGGQQLAVKPGDTAGKIAAQVKPASVSLDQMLAALLRSNPDAFIGGNINRLRSGSVLDIPSAEDASAISAADASTTIIAQSRDFNDFRRKLAESVPAAQVGSANRQAGGKVQAKVEDKAPVAATPDKLTLSKGAVQGKAAAEDKIAKDRQTKEASDRTAELAKNIGDLNKLTGVPTAAANAAATASAAKGTGVAVAKPDALSAALPAASATATPMAAASAVKPAATAAAAVVPSVTPASAAVAVIAQPGANTTSTVAVVTAASAPAAAASGPASVASQAVAVPQASTASAALPGKKLVVAAPPPPEPSLMDELTENPFVLPGFAGLLLLLGGFGFYRYRQRNNSTQVDSSFLESRLQPDSFFGASGGQRVDTNEGGATGSSLVYSPSQLDAAGDVDPVAEADVYLAYGRDLQAEEILKEAIRTTPNRVAIHAKLMEIYAKRRDVRAFEVIAMEAFNLTRGEGPEWAYIGEMGRELDPGNVLYQPGGQPDVGTKETGHGPASTAAFSANTVPQMVQPEHEPASASVDFDLDLDFSADDEPVAVAAAQPIQPPEPTVAFKSVPAPPSDGLDMDFGTGTVAMKPMVTTPPASAPLAPAPGFDEKAADDALSASGLTFTNEPFTTSKPSATPAAAVMDHGMLEFDMGSLSLDLDGPTTESSAPVVENPVAVAEGPLETKFALAEEFRALGDMDGARALADEVLAQAKGSLKSKAQAFVNALS
jgi:pilus assembly protein FimV